MADTRYQIVHSIRGRVRVRLEGIRCNNELAAGLEQLLHTQSGVTMAKANPNCASLTVSFTPGEFDPLEWLDRLNLDNVRRLKPRSQATKKLPPFLAEVRRGTFVLESRLPPKTQLVWGTVAMASTFLGVPGPLARLIVSASLLPIVNRAVQTLLDERRVGADALDSASCLLLLEQGSFVPASVMIFLIGLGELIRDVATLNCQQLIHHQLALSQQSAWLIKGKRRIRVAVEDLQPGNLVAVYEGELIGFQGVVVEGSGTVVPARPEAEFEPVSIKVDDRVSPNTVLTDGKIYVRNEQGASCQMRDPAREKESRRWLQRTQLHRDAMRVGYKQVGQVLRLSLLLLILTRNLHRAASIIYFDFLTGIKIAVPAAVLASMQWAGRRGIVIRNGTALEKLAEVDAVIFVRSGTLTALKPSVTDVFVCDGFSLQEVTRFAAAAEQRYNHLAAHAIYSYAHLQSLPVPERTSSSVISGLGVAGVVEGHAVLVGSTRFMDQKQIDLFQARTFLNQCLANGDSRVCVAVDNKLAGVIAYKDPLRPNVRELISALKNVGISEIAMTTGGSQAASEALAQQAGITNVHYRVLPEEKAAIVRSYKRRGHRVAVVGYDVDDLLALEQADVAITLSTGAESTRHRADVVLTSDSLDGLVEGILIARSGMALARQNLALVSAPNWLGMILSALGRSSALSSTLLNNGSVIIAAANGMRPLLTDEAPSMRNVARDEARTQ